MSGNGAKKSPSPDEQKKIKDKELWTNFEIYFELDKDRYLNNTIYGSVGIKPSEARELIQEFWLRNDDSPIHVRVKFDSDAEHIKASGFDPDTKHSVFIEAVPKNKDFKPNPRESKRQKFLIIRQALSIIPVINFLWQSPTPEDSKVKLQPSTQKGSKDKLQPSTQEDSKDKLQPVVIIKWLHIGDTNAEKYVVCIDNKEVRYIHETVGKSMFEVRIHNYKPKEKHTLQIISKFNDDQDTIKSSPIHFVVPDEETKEITEFISVSKDNKLQGQGPKKKEASQKRTSQSENKLPEHSRPSSSQPKEVKTNATCSCCLQPHNEYPGADHYFHTDYNKQSSASLCELKIVVSDKGMSCSDTGRTNNDNHPRKTKKVHDDDDDVIDGGSAANELTIKITT